MLKRKTLALAVNNLSDARYFAAYEVDLMAYSVNPDGSNLGHIKEMMEWVEGPKVLLQFESWNEALAQFAMSSLTVDGIVLPYHEVNAAGPLDTTIYAFNHPIREEVLPRTIPICLVTSDNSHECSSLDEGFILTSGLSVEDIDQLIQTYPALGIALLGGEEEKVGVKSFDELDEVIDILLEE